MIEVSGGNVVNIVSNDEVSIYLIDHDNIKEKMEGGSKSPTKDARKAHQPDLITYSDDTFEEELNDALSEYK